MTLLKKIIALGVFCFVLLVIWLFNPSPRTTRLESHPYLNNCYETAKPLSLHRKNFQERGIECALLPDGCTGWSAKRDTSGQKKQLIASGARYRISQVIEYSPGPTTPSDIYYFEPVSDASLSKFYYTDSVACLSSSTSPEVARVLVCLKDDDRLRKIKCE